MIGRAGSQWSGEYPVGKAHDSVSVHFEGGLCTKLSTRVSRARKSALLKALEGRRFWIPLFCYSAAFRCWDSTRAWRCVLETLDRVRDGEEDRLSAAFWNFPLASLVLLLLGMPGPGT